MRGVLFESASDNYGGCLVRVRELIRDFLVDFGSSSGLNSLRCCDSLHSVALASRVFSGQS